MDIIKFPTIVLNVIQNQESFLIQSLNNVNNAHKEPNSILLQKLVNVNVTPQE